MCLIKFSVGIINECIGFCDSGYCNVCFNFCYFICGV